MSRQIISVVAIIVLTASLFYISTIGRSVFDITNDSTNHSSAPYDEEVDVENASNSTEITTPEPAFNHVAFEESHRTNDSTSGRYKRFPKCVLIGERKTGTTAVLRFLESHPQMAASPSEVHFFDNDTHYNYGYGWYLQHMIPSLPQEIPFEKSPSYFRTHHVAKRMSELNSDMKLLLFVKDPVKRSVSDFHFCRKKHLPSFDLYKYDTFEEFVLDEDGEVVESFPPLVRSLYDVSMEQWLRHFKLSNFYIVDGGRFAANNPALTLRDIERFLDIEPHFKEDMFYYDKHKGFYCAVETGCLNFGQPHPEVDPAVTEKLNNYFKPHNERFYRMVGEDYGWGQIQIEED